MIDVNIVILYLLGSVFACACCTCCGYTCVRYVERRQEEVELFLPPIPSAPLITEEDEPTAL